MVKVIDIKREMDKAETYEEKLAVWNKYKIRKVAKPENPNRPGTKRDYMSHKQYEHMTEHQKEYEKANTRQYCLHLHKTNNADLIEYLNDHEENFRQFYMNAVREEMSRELDGTYDYQIYFKPRRDRDIYEETDQDQTGALLKDLVKAVIISKSKKR